MIAVVTIGMSTHDAQKTVSLGVGGLAAEIVRVRPDRYNANSVVKNSIETDV